MPIKPNSVQTVNHLHGVNYQHLWVLQIRLVMRVLFTNSNDIPSVINGRTGFYCVRGNDLDRLEKNDFETILKWLKSGVLEVERKTPQPHQYEAIKDILNTLKDEDRATSPYGLWYR